MTSTHLERSATVTIDAAVAWATLPAAADRSYWAQRLSVVRQFARHPQTIDAACEIPPASLLPVRPRRAIPHLYQPKEITALMAAAGTLPMALQAATYQTLIGLLAVTGLRLGEAIRLDRDDVDADHQLLRILSSKFGKSREVALHESAIDALQTYSRLRDQRSAKPRCKALLVSTRGTRLLASSIHETFNRVVAIAGLTARPQAVVRAHTTSDMPLRCGRCWTGIATVSMSKRDCRCSPHTWGTSIPRARSGT